MSETQTQTHCHRIYRNSYVCTFIDTRGKSTQRSSTQCDFSRLSAFADRDTSTSQDPPQPVTGVSMAPFRSLWRHCSSSLHFNLPSFLPPQLKHRGLEIHFRTERGFAHTRTRTCTELTCKLWEERSITVLDPCGVKMGRSQYRRTCQIKVSIVRCLILGSLHLSISWWQHLHSLCYLFSFLCGVNVGRHSCFVWIIM